MIPKEIWKGVPSMPCIEASSHGRIRRKPYKATMPNGGERLYVSSPRFGCITRSCGDARHLYFSVRYGGGIGNVKVHFAVCEAFNGRAPGGLRRVRHLNENGLDNRPENLVWGSQKKNMNDPTFKMYQRNRVSPKGGGGLTKEEKRKGVYDSIMDLGNQISEFRRERVDKFVEPCRLVSG